MADVDDSTSLVSASREVIRMGMHRPRIPSRSIGGDVPRLPRMRGVALSIIVLSTSLMLYTVWLVGRPLYWRVYADFIHRYESEAAQQLIQELQKDAGARCRDTTAYPQSESYLCAAIVLPQCSRAVDMSVHLYVIADTPMKHRHTFDRMMLQASERASKKASKQDRI